MRAWLVVHLPGHDFPEFYRPLVQWIGAAFVPDRSHTGRPGSDELSVTFVPEEGVDVRALVDDLAREVRGLVMAVVVEDDSFVAWIARDGRITTRRETLQDLLAQSRSQGIEPDEVAAARALVESVGIGFVSEENAGLPPGGFGLATFGVGRGKMPSELGLIDQTKERFVFGRGRTQREEEFIGIWDREAPREPIHRFPKESREDAHEEYFRLLKRKRPNA
jgi:hypothetical protein